MLRSAMTRLTERVQETGKWENRNKKKEKKEKKRAFSEATWSWKLICKVVNTGELDLGMQTLAWENVSATTG